MNKTAAAVICAAILVPAIAQAHLVATGMGPLYDGATHFALSPEDSLPVAALAAFAGLRGPRPARLSLALLSLGWFTAGAVTAMLELTVPTAWLATASAGLLLVLGGLLAANRAVPDWACAGAATVLGLMRGAADLSGARPEDGGVLNVLGMTVTAALLFALVASITLPLRRQWAIVAARVAGSWIAAVGLLLAGWMARYGAGVG